MHSIRYIILVALISLGIYGYSQGTLNNGLVHYYPFSGDANDAVGINHGTILNGALLAKDACNNDSSAMFFDGIDDRINATGVDLSSTNLASIAVWVKPTNITYNRYYNICRQGPGAANLLLAYQQYGQNIAFGMNTGGNYQELDVKISSNDHVNGKWHSIVATYDGSNMKLYFDGNLIGSKSKSGSISPPSGTLNTIGSYLSKEYFHGYMDELRYYNRVLTQADVDTFHNYFNGANDTILDSVLLCAGESIKVGQNTYSKSGDYVDTSGTTACGVSLILTNLKVIDQVDTTIIPYNGALYGLLAPGLKYQWFDCLTNKPIINANSNIYKPHKEGKYKLQITSDNCISTSGCHNIKPVGINDVSKEMFKIFPNPVNSKLFFELPSGFDLKVFSVYNLLGKLVLRYDKELKEIESLNVNELSNGMYIVEFDNGFNSYQFKFMKN